MARQAAIEEVIADGAACRMDERRGRGSKEEKDKEAERGTGRWRSKEERSRWMKRKEKGAR